MGPELLWSGARGRHWEAGEGEMRKCPELRLPVSLKREPHGGIWKIWGQILTLPLAECRWENFSLWAVVCFSAKWTCDPSLNLCCWDWDSFLFCFTFYFSITVVIQYYFILVSGVQYNVRHLYNLQSDPPVSLVPTRHHRYLLQYY